MRTRLIATLAVLGVLAAACGSDAGDRATGTDAPIELRPETTDPARPAPSASATPDESRTPGVQPGRTPPVATAAAVPSDDGGLGANSFLYLNRKVPKLTIEVDAVAGAAPSGATLDLLRRRLASVADKPGGITILPTETIGGQADGVWSTDDLATSQARNRDRRSTTDAMVMYLAFLDGRYEEDDAVGVAWSASTVAVFVEHIEEIATLLVGADAIEGAATVHEVGHLLSLVNLGYRSPRGREDPDHPKHSSNPDSVMYWAVDNVGVVTILGGKTEPPTDFDAADRADLAAVQDGDLG